MPSESGPAGRENRSIGSWTRPDLLATRETGRAPAPAFGAHGPRGAAFAWLLTLASSSSCDAPGSDGTAELAPAAAEPSDPATTDPAPPPAPSDPWAEVLASRVLVDGRLGPGSKLVPLETIAAPDAAPACAACALAGKPTLVVAVAHGDAKTDAALRDLDAIHRYYEDNGLSAVAIVAPFAGDRLITPTDPRAVIEDALAQYGRSRIALPLQVPARLDDGGDQPPSAVGTNRVWDEYYAVTTSPLVLLVGDGDRVVFSAAAPADWAALDRAIVDALDMDDPARPRESKLGPGGP